MGYSYGPSIVKDGMVLCLDAANRKSYAGSGTSWVDLTGNNNSGSLINGPAFSNANGGNIAFDGTNDYVNCGEFANNLGEMSAGVWVNTSYTGGSYVWFISKIADVSTGAGWALGTWNFGKVVFITQNAGGAQYKQLDVPTPTFSYAGKWTHIMGTLTGGVNGTIRIYINGVSQALRDSSTGIVTNTSTSEPVSIGKKDNYGGSGWLSGNIAIASVYNRALSASEVLQNYNATKGRFGL